MTECDNSEYESCNSEGTANGKSQEGLNKN